MDAVLYTPGSVEALADGRLPNTVARYGETIRRERALGVKHWTGWSAACRRSPSRPSVHH